MRAGGPNRWELASAGLRAGRRGEAAAGWPGRGGGAGSGDRRPAHPLTFLRMALVTSFTPRLMYFRLAAFFASFRTWSSHGKEELATGYRRRHPPPPPPLPRPPCMHASAPPFSPTSRPLAAWR